MIVILPLMMISIRSASEPLRATEHQSVTCIYTTKMEILRLWPLPENPYFTIGMPELHLPGQTFGSSDHFRINGT